MFDDVDDDVDVSPYRDNNNSVPNFVNGCFCQKAVPNSLMDVFTKRYFVNVCFCEEVLPNSLTFVFAKRSFQIR